MDFFKLGGKIPIVNKNQEAIKNVINLTVKIRKIILFVKYTISKQKIQNSQNVYNIDHSHIASFFLF